jgi:hypothetical protein
MIQDRRQITVTASPDWVFDLIDRMPNKFPVYSFMEKAPFFFLRILLVDGLVSALAAARLKRPDTELKLKVGDAMGPFTLAEHQRPSNYWFSLKSFFFNCQTGYSLKTHGGMTELGFDLIAERPTLMEKWWWFVFKPAHVLFANKDLRVIKEKAEHSHALRRTA